MTKEQRAEAEQAAYEENKAEIWDTLHDVFQRYPENNEFKAAKVGFLIGRACIVAAVTELLEGKTERYNGMA